MKEENHKEDGLSDQSFALIALTRHGCRLALEIYQKKLPNYIPVDLYFPEKFKNDFAENKLPRYYSGKLKDLLQNLLPRCQGIIAIVSLGALVRIIAPMITNKQGDPAIVVVDEKGEYVISVLSGHLGGANDLARNLAENIGARPVITTASDVRDTIAVDLLGKAFGWTIDSFDHITQISAAVVNEEPVAILQESGETGWWPSQKLLPDNIKLYKKIDDLLNSTAEYIIIISHRLFQKLENYNFFISRKSVFFRPRVIGIGLGCNRNTPETEIENVVFDTLEDLQLSSKSILGIATIDLKKNEPGLVSFCNKWSYPLFVYSAEELNSAGAENMSEIVFKHTGAYAVSEPAAKILVKNERLLIRKKISGNVTISVGILEN